MKKIVIIIIVALAVAGLLFLGYYLRSRSEAVPSPTGQTGNLPAIQLPTTTANAGSPGQAVSLPANFELVVDTSTLNYFVDTKNVVTFIRPDGQILKTSDNGIESLSASVVQNISAAGFSFDGKKILATMAGSVGNQTSIFDAERKIWQPLPQNFSGPAWSPNSYQIAYFSNGANGSVLSLLDAGNPSAKPKALLSLHQEDMTLDWLAPNQLLIADKPSALWNSSLWSLDLSKKIISPVVQDRPGLETVWSSSSEPFGLLFSAGQNQQGGRLQLVDKSGNPLKQLNFLTLPSKCVFYDKPVAVASAGASATQAASSSTANASSPASLGAGASTPPSASETKQTRLTLVCAVPRDQRRLSISALPDAYQEKALYVSDDFFEINVSDGGVQTLFNDPAKNLDASNMKIFDQTLYFINRFDKKLYALPLENL